MEGCRRITEGRKKERNNSNFIFWVLNGYSVVRKFFSGLEENSRISQTRCGNVLVIFGGKCLKFIVMSSRCMLALTADNWRVILVSCDFEGLS